ncbi:MAG: flavin reductase [Aeromicrobium sp.]|uniref:flavin reductase family protein n=1 Tax=Aeromicrobium sp. TaxID=1871063 RepID=UPI0039E6D9CD
MTIHTDHPFATPEPGRDLVRRMRGRLPAPVTVWASGAGPERVGLTVSSMLIADGDPARIVGLIDPDSDLGERLTGGTETFAVSVLTGGQDQLAEVFAGLAPAPGGPFTVGAWRETAWGPVLDRNAGWLGLRLPGVPTRQVGWSLLVEAVVEHVEPGEAAALTHVRGRYVGPR